MSQIFPCATAKSSHGNENLRFLDSTIGGPIGKTTDKLDFRPKQICCPIWRFRPFWRDRMERINILRRNRPRVSNFLSHRIGSFFKNHVFGNIGNSLHHQIPPNWSSGLQIGPRFFVESQGTISGSIKPINFPKNNPTKQYFLGNWKTSQNRHFVMKWLPF